MNNVDHTLMDRIQHLDEAHHDQMIDAIAQTDDFEDDDQDPEDEHQERWLLGEFFIRKYFLLTANFRDYWSQFQAFRFYRNYLQNIAAKICRQ